MDVNGNKDVLVSRKDIQTDWEKKPKVLKSIGLKMGTKILEVEITLIKRYSGHR